MADRRDFWLVFLCASSGMAGWIGHCQQDEGQLLGLRTLQRLYEPAAADAVLVDLCHTDGPLDLPTAEAVAGNVLADDPDRAYLAANLLLRASSLGPLGVQALRRLLAQDDEYLLCAAIGLCDRCPPGSARALAPDLAAVVADRGRGASGSRQPAWLAQRALARLGPRGVRELVVLAASDDDGVREIAKDGLQLARQRDRGGR